jgi:hypothetical protein
VPSQPLDTDLPPGLTTLRRWARSHGRTHDYVRKFWRQRPGFPESVGELPARGRHGGGRGELLFDDAALEAWFSAQPDLAPPQRIDPATFRADPEDRITLGRFAALIGKSRGTVTQHCGRPGFPQAGADGRYRAADLLAYWNTRPGRRMSRPYTKD